MVVPFGRDEIVLFGGYNAEEEIGDGFLFNLSWGTVTECFEPQSQFKFLTMGNQSAMTG